MSPAAAAARLGCELISNGKPGAKKTVVFLRTSPPTPSRPSHPPTPTHPNPPTHPPHPSIRRHPWLPQELEAARKADHCPAPPLPGPARRPPGPRQLRVRQPPAYIGSLRYVCLSVPPLNPFTPPIRPIHPPTQKHAAVDVQELLRSLNLKADVLCGHSFGGKIALEYVKQGLERGDKGAWEVPRQTWVFDSLPTAVDRHKAIGENSVWDVIEKLGQVPLPQPTKEGLVQVLIEEKKIPPAIAHWLMTSLQRAPSSSSTAGGYVWAFDLEVIRALFHAYTEACYYETMASPLLSLHHHRIDFIRAGKNTAWTPEVLQKFEEIQGKKGRTNVGIHTLPKAGHWVHVDDLEGMLRVMAPTFLPAGGEGGGGGMGGQ